MAQLQDATETTTYPVRVASRMTGLKPELIRAWESRYGAIRPLRTAGGSRRYSDSDLHRLCVLRDVVDAGHRIGRVGRMTLSELESLLPRPSVGDPSEVEQLIVLFERLDSAGAHRLLAQISSQQAPVAFATRIILPLMREIGDRWRRGDLSVAVEHFASALVRTCLIDQISEAEPTSEAIRVVFATPSGESHDLGALVAALVALGAGADVIFLGADVPVEDLVESVARVRASALALGVVTLSKADAEREIQGVRRALSKDIGLWVGGAGIADLAPLEGVARIGNLEQLEAHIALLVTGIADVSKAQR